MKVLITGFEPFREREHNSSIEAVRRLPERIGEAEIVKGELPVSFARAGEALYALMDACLPDAVICVGQAAGRAKITVERIAINVQDASFPDNDWDQPVDRPVIEGAPAAYFSALPVKKIVKAIQDAGIPADVSDTAGTYVCNAVMYALLDRVHREGQPIPAGFIHVPITPQQAVGRETDMPSMALSDIADGLAAAIRVLEAR